MADPAVEAIIEQTQTHPDQFDLGRNSVAKREEAGAWTAPPAGGGDDGLAAVALACFCEMQGEAPTEGERRNMLLEFSEALKPLKPTAEQVEAAFEIMAEDFKYRVGNYNPFQDSFKNDLATCIRRARGKTRGDGIPARRARDVEVMEAGIAALEKRQASRPPPAEDDQIGAAIKRELALQMTRATFETWVKPAGMVCGDGILTVTAPDETVKGWLENRLATTIKRTAVGVLGKPVEVVFEAAGEPLAAVPEEVEG